ncbi:hypothetical protein [Corallococcus sicarius]|uniref:Uncharacterized protein n=1 Tax=Corallococcus sicarius TaxID=2316726 RepID=A0A3A8P032_9BACT|nr:hypothetical protein [Corallococcus sicarius]RKH47871.1 hypothetical protein D7X12_01305 [Corallococcus sicarius]
MLLARVVRLFVLTAILAVPGIARAQIVVSLYPVQGNLDPKIRTDAEGLIESGVRSSDRRFGTFVLRGPVPLKASCAPKATTECLAGLGRGGAVIYAEAAMEEGMVSVTLSLITAQQQRTKPVNFRFVAGFLDLRPAHFAIEQLEKAATELKSTPVADAVAPTEPQAEVRPAPQAQAVAATPQPAGELDPLYEQGSASHSSDSLYDQPRPSASGWMRKTGIYASIGGALVLGTGGFFGLRSRSLNNDLSNRYTEGRLVPADRPRYDQVKTYNTLANTLMIGGGVVALTGLTFWGLSTVSFDSDGQGGGNFYVRGRW